MNVSREGKMSDKNAFTLLEVLFVLLIVGFLAAGSLRHWNKMIEEYGWQVAYAGVAELNAREKLIWARAVVSDSGWHDDVILFSTLETDLGNDFNWRSNDPTITGGQLEFQDMFTFELRRLPSSHKTPGHWRIHEP